MIAYVAPSPARHLGRWASRLLLRTGGGDVLGTEPQRSFFRAPAICVLLADYGFTVVRDQDLVEIARSLSADTTAMGPFPRAGRVAVTERSS